MTIVLIAGAIFLTFAMFITRERMLGFPCLIFWAIAGGNAYTLSTATWDIYYLVFFAGMGMAIFSAIAMYALREKKDAIADAEMDEDSKETEGTFIDESAEMSDEERTKQRIARKKKRNWNSWKPKKGENSL